MVIEKVLKTFEQPAFLDTIFIQYITRFSQAAVHWEKKNKKKRDCESKLGIAMIHRYSLRI